MPQCEMCGREAELFIAIIEGSQMRVCKDDAKFGKVLRASYDLKSEAAQRQKALEKDVVVLIDPNLPMLLKQKREALGLTQEDFAKKLNEKTSVIHQLESGHMKPSFDLARKLERLIGKKIVQEYEEKHATQGAKTKSDTLTVGDMIKFKTK